MILTVFWPVNQTCRNRLGCYSNSLYLAPENKWTNYRDHIVFTHTELMSWFLKLWKSFKLVVFSTKASLRDSPCSKLCTSWNVLTSPACFCSLCTWLSGLQVISKQQGLQWYCPIHRILFTSTQKDLSELVLNLGHAYWRLSSIHCSRTVLCVVSGLWPAFIFLHQYCTVCLPASC